MSKLSRELTLLDVFCMASGSMISSGLFVLPAIVFIKSGASVILVYLISSIFVLPAVFSNSELSTAMPKAGGTYFFVERTFGPAFGLFTGLANWFSVAMKGAFALVGMAVFIKIVLLHLGLEVEQTSTLIKMLSIICCLFFMTLNIVSVKHASRFQVVLVIFLLLALFLYFITGIPSINVHKFKPFFPENVGIIKFFAAVGMVFVSYGGLTHVVSVAEEVKNPPRNMPFGMFLAWFVVSFLYFAVVSITVGVMEHQKLSESLTPISDSAFVFSGIPGYLIMAIAAMTAFITTANAGLISASRSLLAMSRDKLLPKSFSHINSRFRTPHISIAVTTLFMIVAIVGLNLEQLVKTASALMLILFVLVNVSVIIMRESSLQSYRPTFRSPLYPYIQISAVGIYLGLIIAMGIIPLIISIAFIAFSISWYYLYVSKRVSRRSAIMHLVARVTDKPFQTNTLENELRDILLERDEIIEDRFDQLVKNCEIKDITTALSYTDVFQLIAESFSNRIKIDTTAFYDKLIDREAQGSTVIQPGLAIPHVVIDGENKFEIMLIRSLEGIKFPHSQEPVHCIFVLAGTKDERNYHLRALMAIAQVAQQDDFMNKWKNCYGTEGIRNMILLSARSRQQ